MKGQEYLGGAGVTSDGDRVSVGGYSATISVALVQLWDTPVYRWVN